MNKLQEAAEQLERNEALLQSLKDAAPDHERDTSQAAFAEYAKDQMAKIATKLLSKGREYTDKQDAFENHRRGGEMCDMPMRQWLMVMASKHWHVLYEFARGNRPNMSRAELEDRATDIIVYMLILMFMGEQ